MPAPGAAGYSVRWVLRPCNLLKSSVVGERWSNAKGWGLLDLLKSSVNLPHV